MKDKKLIASWCFYDWANSVYSLVITTAIFPIFYESLVPERIDFFGFDLINTEAYSYTLSFAFVLVALITPFLASISDLIGKRLFFFKLFCYLGALSCISLYYFNVNYLELSMIPVVLALVGFTGSIVFYNSYLPLIAPSSLQDKVSSIGYGYGYLGSAILLIICLVLIQVFEVDARYTFVITGFWWIGFSQITFRALKKYNYDLKEKTLEKKALKDSLLKPLHDVIYTISKDSLMKKYLFAFFIFTMGVQTIMYMAVFFGTKAVEWTSEAEKSTGLIITILSIQFLAILGAYYISKVSRRVGNIKALILILFFWILVSFYAYQFVNLPVEFYIAGAGIGLVMGSVQSLSRSTFSKLVSKQKENTSSFFSVYDFIEKISIVIGIFFYGFIEGVTSDIRNSILIIIAFFVIGITILYPIRKSDI